MRLLTPSQGAKVARDKAAFERHCGTTMLGMLRAAQAEQAPFIAPELVLQYAEWREATARQLEEQATRWESMAGTSGKDATD